ncbi:hypothetical protein BDR04DRAFT_1012233 [Suillus decipiens]|nr:hypothetical protein BDR04DRAFT_1012233 [Suillus decipiens]
MSESYCLLLSLLAGHVDLDDFGSRHGIVSRCSETEINSVVGDRLLTFEDRALLSYVESVLRKTLR